MPDNDKYAKERKTKVEAPGLLILVLIVFLIGIGFYILHFVPLR